MRMLTASQVREMLGISPETLLKLIRDGEFPGAMKATNKPTGHWRIPDTAVVAYLDRNAYKPETASAS